MQERHGGRSFLVLKINFEIMWFVYLFKAVDDENRNK